MPSRYYTVLRDDMSLDYTDSDPYEDPGVKDWDEKLHRSLSSIFGESSPNSGQIKEHLSSPKRPRLDENSIFNQILEREPAFEKQFLKRNNLLSLLWIAVLSCYQKSAKLLVSNSGANIIERLYGLNNWYKLTEKSTILHALLNMYPSLWNEQFIGLLIYHGADLNARDSKMRTILHLALKYGRVKVAEILLEKEANVKATNHRGVTPLLQAAKTNEADELVPLLMKYGADITVKDKYGRNALSYLAMAPDKEHIDLAKVLIEKGLSPDPPSKKSRFAKEPPLHAAVSGGKIKLVNLFLDHGVNVNTHWDYTFPLYIAARNCKDPEMLRTLLKRGANIDLRNMQGETALHVLTIRNEFTVKLVKILLSVGANMFAVDFDGTTPFERTYNKFLIFSYTTLFLKTVALRKACLKPPSLKFEDENWIEAKYRRIDPEVWNYYKDCLKEINTMKSTRFIETCTFFELLTKCQCEIALLMQNPEFESKFRLFDRSPFPLYNEDLREAFDNAIRYHQSMLEKEVNNCEICELKEIVQKSRTRR